MIPDFAAQICNNDLYYEDGVYKLRKTARITRDGSEEQMNYSSDYLNRILKKYTAMTLTEYGQTFYLENARKMLLETDKTISNTIRETGFSNRSYFYRFFAEKYGATPQEYRRANTEAAH